MKKTQQQAEYKAKRGRPVNEALREQIIKAAGDLFLKEGFQAASMDKVAKDLGISKLTLYSRFKNKDELFVAVIRTKCGEYIHDRFFEEFHDHALEESLYSIGCGLLHLLTSQEAAGMERLLMAEAKRKKNLTQLFYEAGPLRIKRLIAEHLQQLHESGELYVPDPLFSAHIFASLFKGSDICMRTAMNISPRPTKDEISAYCRKAVRLFIQAHAKAEIHHNVLHN